MAGDTPKEPARKKVRCEVDAGPDLASKPILVRVGATNDEFYIHEKLARFDSVFFDTALKKEWEEGQERVIKLSGTETQYFKIWMKWLYTGRVFIFADDDVEMKDNGEYKNKEVGKWQHCYIMGDFLQASNFKDALIDTLMEWIYEKRSTPFNLGSWIYNHSRSGSAHRKFAVDVFVNVWTKEDMGRDMEHPAEFLHDVIKNIAPQLDKGVRSQRAIVFFISKDTCKYHDHGPDKPCYKTKPAFRS